MPRRIKRKRRPPTDISDILRVFRRLDEKRREAEREFRKRALEEEHARQMGCGPELERSRPIGEIGADLAPAEQRPQPTKPIEAHAPRQKPVPASVAEEQPQQASPEREPDREQRHVQPQHTDGRQGTEITNALKELVRQATVYNESLHRINQLLLERGKHLSSIAQKIDSLV
jgi:hypothetical protein